MMYFFLPLSIARVLCVFIGHQKGLCVLIKIYERIKIDYKLQWCRMHVSIKAQWPLNI